MLRTLGKYRLLGRLGSGGFAEVYRALDTVEGVRVALKVPHPHLLNAPALEDFRKEIRLTASLDHPNILPLKNAEFVDGQLIVAYSLGDETLADRLRRRLSLTMSLSLGEQMLAALAHAHERRVIHCDVKPENLILFSGDHLRLGDFGIAKVALRTRSASGSGTVGYVAPEQAMGRPSLRSDVFAAGLVLYRMLAGELPAWPYEWPPPGHTRLRRKVPPALVALLRRALQVDHRKRFADAGRMLAAYRRLLPSARRFATRRRQRAGSRREDGPTWRELRHREFLRRYRGSLALKDRCARCDGPVSEPMLHCPWCGTNRLRYRGPTRFPSRCPRCGRGRKLDWRFCAWCYGAGFTDASTRAYTDARYEGRCRNPRCTRRSLMPFARYCSWCRAKVRRPWRLEGERESCPSCGWGVAAGGYWDYCPWCGKTLSTTRRGTS